MLFGDVAEKKSWWPNALQCHADLMYKFRIPCAQLAWKFQQPGTRFFMDKIRAWRGDHPTTSSTHFLTPIQASIHTLWSAVSSAPFPLAIDRCLIEFTGLWFRISSSLNQFPCNPLRKLNSANHVVYLSGINNPNFTLYARFHCSILIKLALIKDIREDPTIVFRLALVARHESRFLGIETWR